MNSLSFLNLHFDQSTFFYFIFLKEKCELACLRAIVLFNPDAPGLSNDVSNNVETLREKVYATLEEHCRTRHEKDTSRFAKLLLRLPALRSIGKKHALTNMTCLV